MRALQGAVKGKEKVEEAVSRTLKTLNVPTRSDHKKVVARVEALEEEIASLKAKLKKASGKERSKRDKK
jgi:polyhydroxyalkanoate synthesis regulator phasin